MTGGWDGIEEFVHVARAGSFTAGARSFGASVTHMSRSIARLEARLLAQLFHRTTRSLRLTDTGRLFYDSCSRIVEERDEAIASVCAREEPIGELRLTCSQALGERFVAPLARAFALEHPALKVRIDLDNTIRDLITEGYDLAVRTGHLADSRLIATRVASRRVVTVAAPAYLDRRGRPADIASLADHNCLIGSVAQWHFAGDVTFRPEGRWRSNNGNALVDAALAGMGVCQLPTFYVQEALAQGLLEEVLPDVRPADEPIWAVYPQRRHLSPKVTLFVAMLRSHLQPMLSGDAPRPVTGASPGTSPQADLDGRIEVI